MNIDDAALLKIADVIRGQSLTVRIQFWKLTVGKLAERTKVTGGPQHIIFKELVDLLNDVDKVVKS